MSVVASIGNIKAAESGMSTEVPWMLEGSVE